MELLWGVMNMTDYLYDKYELVVTEHKGYRVEITYSEDGVERTRKTVPEIQGLTISAKDLSDNEVIQKVLQIAARISDERTVDK
jgi:riboflavin synthase